MKKTVVILVLFLITKCACCQDTIFFNFKHILINNSKLNIDTNNLSIKIKDKPKTIVLGKYNEYEISLETFTKKINNVKYLWVDFFATNDTVKEKLTSSEFEYRFLAVPNGLTEANLTGVKAKVGITYDIQMKPVLKGKSISETKKQPAYISPFDIYEDKSPKQKCKGKVVPIENSKSKAVFRAGFSKLAEYVNENLSTSDAEKNTLYRFIMTVTVDCNGNVKKIDFLTKKEDVQKKLDKKVKQIVLDAGKWKAGDLNGAPVTSTRKMFCKIENGKFIIIQTP